jgi:hypothetical protein
MSTAMSDPTAFWGNARPTGLAVTISDLKANWDEHDLVSIRQAPLSFRVEEAEAIRTTLELQRRHP